MLARFLDPHGAASLGSQLVLVWDRWNIDEDVVALWVVAGLEGTCVCVWVWVTASVWLVCVKKERKKNKKKSKHALPNGFALR